MATKTEEVPTSKQEAEVVYKFCDLQPKMVAAWKKIFSQYIPGRVEV